MSWLFGSWLGGGSSAGGEGGSKDRQRSGKESSKIDIHLSGCASSLPASSFHSLRPQPTPHVKAGNYDLRIPPSPADGLLTGGTPQQHALVEFKRVIQVLLRERCYPPFSPGGTLSISSSTASNAHDDEEGCVSASTLQDVSDVPPAPMGDTKKRGNPSLESIPPSKPSSTSSSPLPSSSIIARATANEEATQAEGKASLPFLTASADESTLASPPPPPPLPPLTAGDTGESSELLLAPFSSHASTTAAVPDAAVSSAAAAAAAAAAATATKAPTGPDSSAALKVPRPSSLFPSSASSSSSSSSSSSAAAAPPRSLPPPRQRSRVVQARRERTNDEAGEEAAARRKARQVIEGAGEGEDPAVAAVLRALEQCVFLGMRRQEFHGVLPFWRMVWTAATGCLQLPHGHHPTQQHGHDRRGFLQDPPGQNHPLAEEVPPELQGLRAAYETVLASGAVNNVVGRARAWLRLCLNMGCLESSLRALIAQHNHLLQVFYRPSASLLLCPEGSNILLALVATLESFQFSLSLLPALDQEVVYPFIDWDADEEEEEEGRKKRRGGRQEKKKKKENKKGKLPPPLREREGKELRSPHSVPPSPQTLIRGLDATKLEDEEEMKRMRQALLHNPKLSFNEHDRSGHGEEGLGKLLLHQVGHGLDRLLLASKGLVLDAVGEGRVEGEEADRTRTGSPHRPMRSPQLLHPPHVAGGGNGGQQVEQVWGESLERLCADSRLSPHALLAPDMALPTVFAEMIDSLATDEGAATSSLFDAEVSEPRSVLHILDLANRGFRLPAVPRNAEAATTHFRAVSVALMEFLDALPEPLLGWHHYDAVIQAVTRSDLIEDQEARLRNLRLLLGEIPAVHKPLLCKLTAMCHRLLQEPRNGLTSRYLAECMAPGLVRSPYMPDSISARIELARLMQNEEEIIVTQALIEHRPLVLSDLDAEQEGYAQRLQLKWDRLLLLRHQLEEDPTRDEEEEEGKGEGKEGRKDALARAVASRLAGVEAALQRIRCVSASTDEWQITGGGSPVRRRPPASSAASSSSLPSSPACLTPADSLTTPSDSSSSSFSPSKQSFAIGVRKDILEVLEAKTKEDVVRSEVLTLTPSTIEARLRVCGFPCGDLSDFRASGGGVLSVSCLLFFFQQHPQHAALLAFKYARRPGFCFTRVICRVVRMVMGVLHLGPSVREEHLLLHMCQAPWWDLLSEPMAVPSLVSLSLLLLDYLARHEALRPHEEDIFVLEAKRQLTWVLKQGPPSLDAAWHLWLSVRLEKLRAFARAEKARVYRKQFPQEFSALPSYPNTEPAPPPALSEASARLASMALSPSASPSASPSRTAGPAHFNAAAPLPPSVSLVTPRLLGLPLSSSSILSSLTPSQLISLEAALPPQHRDYAWRLLYSLAGDGASLNTFFKKAKNREPTLLVLKDMQGGVFGGFATRVWMEKGESYYGDGESFVWSLVGEVGAEGEAPLRKYAWSTENSYFQLSTSKDGLAMGGGGSFALFVDPELLNGSSGACETFFSSPLHLPPSASPPAAAPSTPSLATPSFPLPSSLPAVAKHTQFEILDLELWALEADYMEKTSAAMARGRGVSDGKKGVAAEMESEVEKADRGRGW
ncbi:hypothetical protein VYU27_007547 [Nannochloropsis oceanica]